ncbi:MAG TPA: alpha/beta fold hydrolase [Spirochaetia bacterium]|nr:alpha/beta fold hydrolase [Spirochaetia bacterium]
MKIPPGLERHARSAELPASGVRLFFYDAGSPKSPAALLIHGLGDEADTWRKVIEPLSSSYHVIAPDLPGFGRSSRPRGRRLTPPYLRAVLFELLDILGIPSALFAGSSLGAVLAQLCAVRDPRRVSRLVLADGGLLARGRLSTALVLMLVPLVGERRYRALGRDLDAAFASLFPYYGSFSSLSSQDREFLRVRVGERVRSDTQRRAYFSFFRSFFLWMFFNARAAGELAARLPVETLYLWGARDHIIPLAAGEQALRLHPGARLAVIPAAGHLPHQEAPAEFLRLLS